MHIAEAGAGPLVLFCHGWPESWYSWRHQIEAVAEAGYRAVAPDMRGYGQSDKPDKIDQYTLFHLTGDMIGILDALKADTAAVIVGHDWGAPVAWHSALFRPDRFKGVVGLSVPFIPRRAARPTSMMPRTESQQFYQLYFQEPGVAEAELERDVRRSIATTLFEASGDSPLANPADLLMLPIQGGWLSERQYPKTLPPWLKEADIDFYSSEFGRSGFAGGLNWYRNVDRNWELLAPWSGAAVTVPALFMVGDRDLVYKFPGMDQFVAKLSQFVPQLRAATVLGGCGHWTQQERPAEVNEAIISFLASLG